MTDIPKQDLLAKLLKMTTSNNDGEALAAIRKANALLASAGWDWDKLLAGKIRIAADPFASLQTPYNPGNGRAAPQPAPPPVRPHKPAFSPPPPPPPQPRQPPPPPQPFEPYSHRSTMGQPNIYSGNCYCCGHSVGAKDGKLFVPSDFNKYAQQGKKVICTVCDNNRHANIDQRPAMRLGPRPFTGPAPTASDL